MRLRTTAVIAAAVAASVGMSTQAVQASPSMAQAPAAAAPFAGAARDTSTSRVSRRLRELAGTPALARSSASALGSALSLAPTGAGSLIRSGSGAVRVEVGTGAVDGALLERLTNAGASIVHASTTWRTVTVDAQPSAFAAIAAVPGVRFVQESLRPIVHGFGAAVPAAAGICGAARTEGDTQLHADQARAAYGVDGTGVRVGIISDSYNQNTTDTKDAADDIASGDLPGATNPCGNLTPVTVTDATSGSDEGRAMTQIVHDLAPGATLAFSNAGDGGVTAFADSVTALAAAGATVIVDDLGFGEDPFYQQGPGGVAYAAARAGGSIGLVASGNDHVESADGKSITSYEAMALRTTACPAAVLADDGVGTLCHDFDTTAGVDSTFRITVPAGSGLRLNLQWAEPWDGVTTDLDVYALNTDGTIAGQGNNDNLATQRPFDQLSVDNTTGAGKAYDIVVARRSGSTGTPRFKVLNTGNGLPVTSFEYPDSVGGDVIGGGEAYGHQGDPSTISVGATSYSDGVNPEPFSSTGDITYLFGPVRPDGTPAAALPAPRLVQVPDVVGTDGGANTYFGGQDDQGTYRFGGTSAAAPHVAAVAALMQQRQPGISPDALQATLRSTTDPMIGTQQEVGTGRVNAFRAVGALTPPDAVVPEVPMATLLPLTFAGLAGGFVVVRRRRTRRPA